MDKKLKSQEAIQVDMWHSGFKNLGTWQNAQVRPLSWTTGGPKVRQQENTLLRLAELRKLPQRDDPMTHHRFHGSAWYIYLQFMLDVYCKMWVIYTSPMVSMG